jgi:hypothetical protein
MVEEIKLFPDQGVKVAGIVPGQDGFYFGRHSANSFPKFEAVLSVLVPWAIEFRQRARW